METVPAPGRVVMVVANRVEGDSRVQKAAASMADAGWEVHLLGFTTGARKEQYRLGAAHVHRVPIPKLRPAASLRRLAGALRHPLAYADPVRADQEPARIKAGWIELEMLAHEHGSPRREGLLRMPLAAHRLGRKIQRVWIGRRVAHSRAKDRYLKRRDGRLEAIERRWWPLLLGDRAWRRLEPDAERIELALRPEILRLEPDLLHAHDVYPLGVCVRAAAHLEREGRDVKVLYDAHEFVPGCESFGPTRLTALTGYERQYLPYADSVVTVSKPLAELLQRTHGLDREPRVVHNAPPIEHTDRPDPGDLRSACGVPAGAPLAVYCGAAGPERQLEVMIEAARDLPDLHMAFMLGSLTTPYAKSLTALGERLGVSDRLHFRGYVHYADLPRFLATADVGVVPIQVGPINHEVCLASKFFEYAHARLPVVVSNTAAMSAEVRRVGNGEVFRGGDAADLAAALRRVLAGPDAYREAYRDPETLAEFTWERQVRSYVEAYEELIGPAAPAVEAAGPGLREQCGTDRPIVAVLGAEDEDWAGFAAAALAGLGEAHVALLCADPAVRERLADAAGPGVTAVAPAAPADDFLSAADAAVLPPAERPGDRPPHLAAALGAAVPVVAETVDLPLAGLRVGEAWDRSDPVTLASAVRAVLAGSYPLDAARSWARLDTPTPWPRLGDSPIRLGMGTANFAGQLAELARAVSWHRADVTAEVVAADTGSPLRFPADEYFQPREQDTAAFQAARVRRVLGDYSHLVLDALRPAFGWLNGRNTEGDLPLLRNTRLRTALLMHGTEIRDPDAHLARHEHSPYHDASPEDLATLRRNTPKNRRIAVESGLPLFVTTPDLLDDLPQARWLPLTVDVDRWQCAAPIMERPRPVVLHAPSTRWSKGTAAVVPVLERLHEQGLIEFRLAEGVTPARMRELVHEADVVIDQLAIGSYGVLACESMAAGKPVVAYLHESVSERVGAAVPIVNATPKSIEEVLVSLCEDRDRAREIGAASRRFARRFHDGRASVEALGDFLDG